MSNAARAGGRNRAVRLSGVRGPGVGRRALVTLELVTGAAGLAGGVLLAAAARWCADSCCTSAWASCSGRNGSQPDGAPKVPARGERQGPVGARGDAGAVRQPIGVGPEMAALSRFYRDVTWKGTIHAGGMG